LIVLGDIEHARSSCALVHREQQKLGVPEMFWSICPVYKLLLTNPVAHPSANNTTRRPGNENAPIANVPPGTLSLTCVALMNLAKSRRPISHSAALHMSVQTTHRVSWNDITGSVYAPPLANVSQNCTAPGAAIVCHARPNSPDTGLVSRPDVT